ncbi:unnamed protein product [Amoebophrya sp. A120]|nr:unnamed protein product [Amoebophrya sp. A120]|eukprot:GSA120T00019987001.1
MQPATSNTPASDVDEPKTVYIDGKMVEVTPVPGSDGQKVTINGQEFDIRDIHNDTATAATAFFPHNDEEISVEETFEECFINDCRFGELEDVKQTLVENPDKTIHRHLVNAQNEKKQTALMMAASNGHADIVDLLLQIDGIDLTLQNEEGSTALHWAAFMGRKQICAKICARLPKIKDLTPSTTGAGAGDENEEDEDEKEVLQNVANLFNNRNKKPFDVAFEKNYTGVCEVLAEYTNFKYCSPEPDEETDKNYRITPGMGGSGTGGNNINAGAGGA